MSRLGQVFRHQERSCSCTRWPLPRENVPEGCLGGRPLPEPSSKQHLVLASGNTSFPLCRSEPRHSVSLHKDLYSPSFPLASGHSTNTVQNWLDGIAFSHGFQKYNLPKIGDPCTLSQGPFVPAIFVFSFPQVYPFLPLSFSTKECHPSPP